jgi:hypothetical protein
LAGLDACLSLTVTVGVVSLALCLLNAAADAKATAVGAPRPAVSSRLRWAVLLAAGALAAGVLYLELMPLPHAAPRSVAATVSNSRSVTYKTGDLAWCAPRPCE